MRVALLAVLLCLGGCGIAVAPKVERNFDVGTEGNVYAGQVMIASRSTSGYSKSFEKGLYYMGRHGSVFDVEYREFVNGYARPAFTERFSFDANPGAVFTVKGITMQVIDCTDSIHFRVVTTSGGVI